EPEIMAEEQPKQPRKNLKARLGRTIAPGVQPGGVGGDGVAPPPGGDEPIPPPANLTQGGPVLGASSVVVPPFLQKQKKRGVASDDPFAAGEEPQGPREVRLVFDDKAVAESETGRAGRRGLIGAIAGAALYAVRVGYGSGSAMYDRRIHNNSAPAAARYY